MLAHCQPQEPGIYTPSAPSDMAVVTFDGTTGRKLQASNVTINDTTGLVTIAQLADSVGLKITGYDDKSGESIQLSVDSSGYTQFTVTDRLYINTPNWGYLQYDGNTIARWSDGVFKFHDNIPIQLGTDSDYSIGYNSADDTLRIADGSDLTTTPRMVLNSSGAFTLYSESLVLDGSSPRFSINASYGQAIDFYIDNTDSEAQFYVGGKKFINAQGSGGYTDFGHTSNYTRIYGKNTGGLPAFAVISGSNTIMSITGSALSISGHTIINDNITLRLGTDSDYSIGYNSADDTLRIADGNDLTTTPRIVLDSSGNVGINCTPTELLDVSGGNIRLQGDTGSGYGYSLYIEDELGANALRLYGDGGLGKIVSSSNATISMGAGISITGTDNSKIQTSAGYLWLQSASYIQIGSAAGQAHYYGAGGLFVWRDIDDSNATRMTLDSATGALTLNSTAVGITVNQSGTGEGVYVNQTGNGPGLRINNDGTNHGLYLHQDGVLTGGDYGLYVYSNAVQVNSPLVCIIQNNTSSSQAALEIINGSTTYALYINNTNDTNAIYAKTDYSSGYTAFFINDGNNADRYGIQIQGGADDASGTTIYINCLDGDGDQVGYIENNSGTFQLVDGSDIRLKRDNVPTAIIGLDIIRKLEVEDFYMKKSGAFVQAGFIAQKVFDVFSPAVSISCDPFGYMGVSRERMVPVIVKAVQEVDDKLEKALAKIKELEKEVKYLKAA